ncbi:GerAB/ArcD/ProY family transporter [Halalkalibacter alkaliphilus]|uniref:Endospore germination permease n=1 Tax=Halalkalibacter alkaliphilus TaxID=2917993 RepID=A0A9X2CU62_9BACI|nr:endospore germination permease [Halalkalibacter alkaliphilus]MCL7748318.1 endospore germination permease [Halalkalibacter alkaliphilus]
MRQIETISSWQLASLFLAYMTGSAIINIPTPMVEAAANGAWLSLLIANALGMVLLACVFYIDQQAPGHSFIDYSEKVLGKWITLCIAIPLIILLILIITFIIIDIGGFFANALMRETPTYVFHTLILLVAAMTARSGIEPMARMFVWLLIIMVVLSLGVLALVFREYRVEHLLPVMPDGIMPILLGSYRAFSFPYSELILFSLLLPFLNKGDRKPFKKIMFFTLIIHGLLMIIPIVLVTMAYGPIAGKVQYSIFNLSRLVNIRDAIERIESGIGLVLIVGSYMKTSIMLFILKEFLSKVLKLQDKQIIIFPISFLILLLSLTIFDHETEFVDAVFVTWPLFMITIVVLPFLFVTFVAFIKRNKHRSNNKATSNT